MATDAVESPTHSDEVYALGATEGLGTKPSMQHFSARIRQAQLHGSPPERKHAETKCTARVPVVGDRVLRRTDAAVILGEPWRLAANEVATVVEVDSDGNFRLRKDTGEESSTFSFRENYFYEGRQTEESTDLSESELSELSNPSIPESTKSLSPSELSASRPLSPASEASARWELAETERQTVIIFDWDDTLLCTSSLADHKPLKEQLMSSPIENYESLPKDLKEHLVKTEYVALRLLELAVALGQTYIITNGRAGWVEQSARYFMPSLLPVLDMVEIISAKAMYCDQYPDDIGQWKLQTFLDLQCNWSDHVVTNLVALGDAQYEMDAANAVMELADGIVKTVRLVEQPTARELHQQLDVIQYSFLRLVQAQTGGNFCLRKYPWTRFSISPA